MKQHAARDVEPSLQMPLLGFLMAGPKHGYELYQEFGRELGRAWHIGLSQLYAHLKQLEEAGLVEAVIAPQANRPARKVYSITEAGREVFLEWVHQPTPYLNHIRLEFLAHLYFFRRLGLPGLEGLVAEQKELCRARAETLAHAAAETEDDFWRLVLEFRHGQLEAAIRWLDRCLELH